MASFGSEDHKAQARANFEEQFETMVSLMTAARRIELRLRIYYELLELKDEMSGKPFDQYVQSNFKVDRRKFDRILKSISPDDRHQEFESIRLLADELAHGNYRGARRRIDAFVDEFGIEAALNSVAYGERAIESIRNEKGEAVSYYRLIESGDKNTTVEEFLVFRHNGYVEACEELFQRVTAFFDGRADLGWLAEILSVSRAFKFGVEQPNGGPASEPRARV